MAKNDHFLEDGNLGRIMPLLPNFFVDSYDLKSMSFKFGNDIFIIFEMPMSSFLMSVGKMNISLLFLPSASEVLDSSNIENANPNLYCTWCMEEMTHVHLQASQPMTVFLCPSCSNPKRPCSAIYYVGKQALSRHSTAKPKSL